MPIVRIHKQGNARNILKKNSFHFILFPPPTQSVKQQNCEIEYHITV